MFSKLISLFAFIVAVNAGVIENSDADKVQALVSYVADVNVRTLVCVVVNAKIVLVFPPNQMMSNRNNLNQITASTALLILSDSFTTISDVYTILGNASELYGKPFIIFLTRNVPSGGSNTAVDVHFNKCVYNEPVQTVYQDLGILGVLNLFVRVLTFLEQTCDVAQFNILNDSLKGFNLIG